MSDGAGSTGRIEDQLLLEPGNSPPDDWVRLLDSDPGADYFHTSHWTCCARDHFPHLDAFWLLARLEGRLVGGLAGLHRTGPINKWESNLEGTSGGPLLHSSLGESDRRFVFQELMKAYVGLRGSGLGTTCVSINHHQEKSFGSWLRESNSGWQYQDTPAAVIPLAGGIEFVAMNLMKKNKRNERNRALRRDATVFITDDEKLMAAYYPIYEKASQLWNIAPAPLSFLQALLADPHTLESGFQPAFFTCVMLGDKVIGGHLNLQYKDRVIAWNGVTDPEFAKTHFPATLAVWGDLEESCRRGASLLDLGGSGGVVSLEGFKKNFGANSESRGHYVLDSTGMKILRGGKKLLSGWRDSRAEKKQKRWHDTDPTGESSS